MAITVEERFKSRQGSAIENERLYLAVGDDDDAAIRDAVDAAAPSTSDAGVKMSDKITVEQIAGDTWFAVVPYGAVSFDTSPAQTGESVFSFNTGGSTIHVQTSLSTVGAYPTSGTPSAATSDYKNLIGVNQDGEAEGVDITQPAYAFSETKYISNSSMTVSYRSKLYRLTGRVNNASWVNDAGDTFAAGEVLFLGVSGSRRGRNGDWELTFNFAAAPNVTGLTVGDVTGVAKKGWEYLWTENKTETTGSGGNKRNVTRPVRVYVEQVYRTDDFGDLDP
jgi:hypothetical protein